MQPLLGGKRRLLPWAVLVVALSLTAVAASYADSSATLRASYNWRTAAERVVSSIEARLDAYIAMLHGAAGLFAASDNVSWPEFRAYVERLHLQRRYPGLLGIGFSRLIRPAEREQVAAEMRAYVPEFDYWHRDEYAGADGVSHAIVFLEPQNERNRAAMGYDMFSEPTRRAAMERARDSGSAAASGRVRLVQEIDPSNTQAGFLIYVPVYRGGKVPTDVEARRRELVGFVYSPFRADDLFAAIIAPEYRESVEIDIYDGPVGAGAILHQSPSLDAEPRFADVKEIELAGRRLGLALRSGRHFARFPRHAMGVLVGGLGLTLSLLIFTVVYTLTRARESAERTAEELRRSEEALRAAHRAKDEFLAVVSHELRTPLNAIMGWAAMLRRGQLPPESFAHALEVIERNAVAQARLVEDLLDVSRAVAGRLRIDVADVDVAATLRAAADAVRPEAEARRIRLDCRIPPDLGTIPADPSRLQQIVLNLLSNGIKFTPPEGHVTLEAARDSRALAIRVVDTGIGIHPEFLPHVFERFRQADASTTRAYSGIGLGLAIARHLVELHAGTIDAVSEGEGRGAAFTVRIPVAS